MTLNVPKTLGKLLADARQDEDTARIMYDRAKSRRVFLEAAHQHALTDHTDGRADV